MDALDRHLSHESEILSSLDGDGYVRLNRSTADLSVAECEQMIELIFAFGSNHDVTFHEPEDGARPAQWSVDLCAQTSHYDERGYMTRDTRIYVRIRQEDKDLIEKAARSLGSRRALSLSRWLCRPRGKVKEGKRR